MKNKINDILIEINGKGLSFKLAETSDFKAWNSVKKESDFCPIDYDWNNIDYQQGYFENIFERYDNISILIYKDKSPVAIWPLCIFRNNGNIEVGTNGREVVAPLFSHDAPKKIIKTVIKTCFNILGILSDTFSISNLKFREVIVNGISDWCVTLFDISNNVSAQQIMYVDLTEPLSDIKLKFRKSYRPLVTKGEKIWKSAVVMDDKSVFEEFRSLHREVAGRETRPDSTWKRQYEMLIEGTAFMITIRNESDQLVGAGFFMVNESNCTYAVAAYKRDLFLQPLGHVVQYKAIEHMINLDLKWYELGEVADSRSGKSEKELSISQFKSGFCTKRLPLLMFCKGNS